MIWNPKRDTLMFLLGAAGFLHELLVSNAERPFLLTLCGALMGLPFVLGYDQKRNQQKDSDTEGK